MKTGLPEIKAIADKRQHDVLAIQVPAIGSKQARFSSISFRCFSDRFWVADLPSGAAA